jgi:hypothetical protein
MACGARYTATGKITFFPSPRRIKSAAYSGDWRAQSEYRILASFAPSRFKKAHWVATRSIAKLNHFGFFLQILPAALDTIARQ